MGCASCGKNNARRRKTNPYMYITCAVCKTVLHGKKKDMKKISGNFICGECYMKYKKMKELEKNGKS